MEHARAIVDTCLRSNAEAASGDRTPTPKENLDHPVVLVKQFPKQLLHIIQRDPRTYLQGNTIDSLVVRRTPHVMYANAQKSRRAPCRRNPESRERIAIASSIFGSGIRFGCSTDTELSVRNKTAPDTTRSVQRFWPPESKPGLIYTDNSLGFTNSLRRSVVESRRIHSTSIRNKWTRRKGGQKSKIWDVDLVSPIWIRWTIAESCDGVLLLFTKHARLISRWKSSYERRYDTPFRARTVPFGSKIFYHPISTRDQKNRLHQFSSVVLKCNLIGYALNAGGGWTGERLVADAEELKNNQYHKQKMVRIVIPPTRVDLIRTWSVCRGTCEWRVRNRILVVQLGTNEEEAKVFRARAVPQALCENLSSSCWRTSREMVTVRFQNIVTGLRGRSREAIMNGLRSFIASEKYCAVEVGHLRRCQRPFKVIRPKIRKRAPMLITLTKILVDRRWWTLARLLPNNLWRNWRKWVGRAVLALQRYE